MATRKWEQYTSLANFVDSNRIIQAIEQLGAIGDTPGDGVTRLAYSSSYREAKNTVANMMKDAGLEVEVSPIGNTFGRLGPNKGQAPVILTGSHTDTVVHGGRFDGVAGVVCAIEALRVLRQVRDELTYPIEVADFAMEEAARFGSMYGFGSYVLAGGVVDENMLLRKDERGVTLAEAIQEIKGLTHYPTMVEDDHLTNIERALGYIERSRLSPKAIKAFVELHVEQGQVLEESGIPIGIVTGAAAATRLQIDLRGQQSHSGTTPMHKRKDALCAAAEVVLLVNDLCRQEAENETVGAITKLIVEPNVVNIVPGHSVLSLDLRGTSQESKNRVVKALRREIDRISSKWGVETEVQVLADERPTSFSLSIVRAIEESCAALGISFLRMPSRAGHDACHVAKIVDDVGMIFMPSKDGLSHNPSEWTDVRYLHYGTQILLLTLLQLAME